MLLFSQEQLLGMTYGTEHANTSDMNVPLGRCSYCGSNITGFRASEDTGIAGLTTSVEFIFKFSSAAAVVTVLNVSFSSLQFR